MVCIHCGFNWTSLFLGHFLQNGFLGYGKWKALWSPLPDNLSEVIKPKTTQLLNYEILILLYNRCKMVQIIEFVIFLIIILIYYINIIIWNYAFVRFEFGKWKWGLLTSWFIIFYVLWHEVDHPRFIRFSDFNLIEKNICK